MPDESHLSNEPDLWDAPNEASSEREDTPKGGIDSETSRGFRAPGSEQTSSEMWSDALATEEDASELLRPKSLESLLRLREQVEAAAEELTRLRQENAALRERIEELETVVPQDLTDGTMVVFDDDPEKTRRKVEHFIAAIDRYLSRHQTHS